MAKQLLLDGLQGKRTETTPWMAYAGTHMGFLIGETVDNYFQDPDLLIHELDSVKELAQNPVLVIEDAQEPDRPPAGKKYAPQSRKIKTRLRERRPSTTPNMNIKSKSPERIRTNVSKAPRGNDKSTLVLISVLGILGMVFIVLVIAIVSS